MTEYLIVVALIAVAAIGVTSHFGKALRNQVAALTQELAGSASATSVTNAQAAASAAASAANTTKTLGNFNEGNP